MNQSLTTKETASPTIAEEAVLSQSHVEKAFLTTEIRPAGAWFNLEWREFWNYRELLYFLALRDLKVRYKQSLLGVAWVLLQPIATTLVFAVLFSRFGQIETSGIPYALFAFCGFVVWTFVSSAITSASNSLVNHTALITKAYFPRLIIPVAAITAHLLDLLIGLISLAVAMVLFGVAPDWKIVFAPFFVVLILLQVFAAGIALSALNVRFRDVKQLLPFALQLWLFITPVFYSLKMLPERLAWLWKLNPLTGALDGFRTALFGGGFDLAAIAFSVVITLVSLLAAISIFRRMEDDFADVI